MRIFFFFFLIQFNVPFKIISLIETSQSIGGRNGRTPGKPPDTPASRTWLVSHVASAGTFNEKSWSYSDQGKLASCAAGVVPCGGLKKSSRTDL